jgi:tRNA-5-methyluridine54 2-sulfurtransferase
MARILPELPVGAKCTSCRSRGTIRLPQHHTIFCAECFLRFFKKAVVRAMKTFGLAANTPLLVAVSGGKDSLALWDVLHDLGYQTKGLHIELGIDGFSEASMDAVRSFAEERSLPWAGYSLKEALGYDLYEIRRVTRREMCSVCGLLKRQLLNRLTVREGFGALAVGHNLDDEAGRLLGNIVRHRDHYLKKQSPFLPSTHPRLPAKLKPLYRLEASEVLTYCTLKGIRYVALRCPLSRNATSHFFKEALDLLESRMPATKRDFLFTYLDRNKPYQEDQPFMSCAQCGEPAYADLCSVCKLLAKIESDHKTESM